MITAEANGERRKRRRHSGNSSGPAYTPRTRRGTVTKQIRRGPGKRMVDGKSFRLADEVSYIQRRAVEHDERVVRFGQIVPPHRAMRGSSMVPTTLPHGWPAMAIPSRWRWR